MYTMNWLEIGLKEVSENFRKNKWRVISVGQYTSSYVLGNLRVSVLFYALSLYLF